MSVHPTNTLQTLFMATTLTMLLTACGGQGSGATGQPPVLTVLTIEAEQRDVPLFIEMVGSTLGTQDVPIRARVDGFLESMDFNEGTFVDEGDLLYTIDAQPFQAKLLETQSQLVAAQTQLIHATADLERIRPLAEMNAVSQQDLDSAIANESAARATVEASKATRELAEIELSYTRIIAPIDGLIGLSNAKPGEYVGREPNPVVLNTLSDIDPIRVRFSISEREYLIMARTYMALDQDDRRIGKPESHDNQPDLELILADGTVHDHKGLGVGAAQSIDSTTGTFSIEAAFPNPDGLLLPGQFARVRARYDELQQVVVVPRRAITELQGLFRAYVVSASGAVEVREVVLGPESGHDVVIEHGVNAGETVIVEGVQKVRPGMTVNPQPWVPATTPGSKPAQEA